MMREIDGALHGPEQDRSFLDTAEVTRQADVDDEAFDHWLGSLSPAVFDRFLSDLHHEADALFRRIE